MPDYAAEAASRNGLDVNNPANHVQDLSMDAVALANSPHAVTFADSSRPPPGFKGGGKGGVGYNKVKYNARKDRFLRCAADDTLQRHADVLPAAEPTVVEAGGYVPKGEPDAQGRKCVHGLSPQRVSELIAHMAPLSMRNKGAGVRLPGDIASIRLYQAGRMEFELNRLRLLRERRTAALAALGDGPVYPNKQSVRTVLGKLYGSTQPQLETVLNPMIEKMTTELSIGQLVELIGKVDMALGLQAFAQADHDGSGALDADEVLALLNQTTPDVSATMGDVMMLMTACDVDGSGKIESNEMQPLMDEWHDMATQKRAAAKKSSACAIL